MDRERIVLQAVAEMLKYVMQNKTEKYVREDGEILDDIVERSCKKLQAAGRSPAGLPTSANFDRAMLHANETGARYPYTLELYRDRMLCKVFDIRVGNDVEVGEVNLVAQHVLIHCCRKADGKEEYFIARLPIAKLGQPSGSMVISIENDLRDCYYLWPQTKRA